MSKTISILHSCSGSDASISKRSGVTALCVLLAFLLTACGILRSAETENQRFENYTNALFCSEVQSNSISLHYTLKDPSSYGISDPEVSLGSFTTDTDILCASYENANAYLSSFQTDRLSDKNRLTCSILSDYYDLSLELAPFALYAEPLAPLTGTQAQLPIVFSEYRFYSLSDVDTYLQILTKVPAWFDAVLEFEKARADLGIFMSEESLNALVDECRAFIETGTDNYLYSSFEARLDAVASRSFDREKYIRKNEDCMENYVFPGYQRLADGLISLRHKTTDREGLSTLPDGQKYYELLVKSSTGSERSIQQLQSLTRKQLIKDFGALQEAVIQAGYNTSAESGDSPASDFFSAQGILLEDSNPMSLLTFLQEKTQTGFPSLASVDVQVKYVSESMEEYLSPAFYMIPAIDNFKENVIYINSGQLTDDLSLFTTLAHEGYPGHLYQNVYYMSQNPDPIRCLLDFGGYTEGWATYAEMMSYYYAPVPKETATIMQKNSSILLGLYALADMGIHYDCWSLNDTIRFFQGYGIGDAETVQNIYERILQDPANYLKYYIGYLEFLELKKEAVEKWGESFTQKRFHKAVLDVGPAPFWIVEEQIFGK